MYSAFDVQRGHFLQTAISDTIRWCAPPEHHVGRFPSDQFWLARFAPDAGALDAATAHTFLKTFMLTNRITWRLPAAATVIDALRDDVVHDPIRLVETYALRLGSCTAHGERDENHRQTSAASKFAAFAKPELDVFIWDRLATRSARLREARSAGRHPNSLRNDQPYRDDDRRPSYAGFVAACHAAREHERQRGDFNEAVDKVFAELSRIGGPIVAIGRPFVERRLLDKLMFWEGDWLRRNWDPRNPELAVPPTPSVPPSTATAMTSQDGKKAHD